MIKRFLFLLSAVLLFTSLCFTEDSVDAEVLILKNRFYGKKILRVLRDAKKTIRLVLSECEYEVGESKSIITKLLKELVLQTKRGILVEVVLERGDGKEFGLKNTKAWDYLYENGVKVISDSKKYKNRSNFLIVDDFYCILGSLSWTLSSFYNNRELVLWIESEEFAKRLRDLFDGYKIYSLE